MMQRFLLGVILFLYIIIIFFSACTNLAKKQSHIDHKRKIENLIPDNKNLPYENFVFIEKYVYSNLSTNDFCNYDDISALCQFVEYSTGSGIAISKKGKNVKLLTVHHVCSESNEEKLSLFYIDNDGNYRYPLFYIKVKFYGKEYEAKIIKYDSKNDLCLLEFESEYAYKIRKIKIAKKTEIGERIYSISAPLSMHSATTRFKFEGSYAGCNKEMHPLYDFCYFAIPSAPGSSGSGIFNEKGELISILALSLAPFPEISAGPRRYYIKKILN